MQKIMITMLAYLLLFLLGTMNFKDFKMMKILVADASPVIPKRRWKGYVAGDGDLEDYLKEKQRQGMSNILLGLVPTR